MNRAAVLIAIDSQRRVTAWNQAAEGLFGWSAGEVLGHPFDDLLGEESQQTPKMDELLQTILTKGSCREEMVIGTRSGISVLIEVDAVAMHDPHTGQPTGIVAAIRDISLRRLVQTSDSDNEQRLRAVIEHMPVGVWLINNDGQIVMGNYAGQAIWAGARFVGLDHFGEYRAYRLDSGQLLKPEEWAGYRAITYGETTVNELLEIECFDGTRKIIRNSCMPFWDGGELLGAIVVNEDITDLRHAQDDLKRYANELERSNRDLQDFAFVASHDLQEPLRKFRSFSDLLQRRMGGSLDVESMTYIARMQQAADRMQRMINDLLAYSRVATQGQPFQPVALEQVLADALANLEGLVERTGGQVQIADPMPIVQGDPSQLRQLFQNILGNALKFHRTDAAPLVQVLVRSSDKQRVQLVVRDNGIGFPMQYAERIFQPFQRLHGRAQYEGNGIGLSICRRIIERHNGSIEVNSTPGAGSEFTITLNKATNHFLNEQD